MCEITWSLIASSKVRLHFGQNFGFAFGAALMWFFSIFSYFENRAKYKEELAERVAEVRELEGANKVLLDTLKQNSIANPLEVVTETQGTN